MGRCDTLFIGFINASLGTWAMPVACEGGREREAERERERGSQFMRQQSVSVLLKAEVACSSCWATNLWYTNMLCSVTTVNRSVCAHRDESQTDTICLEQTYLLILIWSYSTCLSNYLIFYDFILVLLLLLIKLQLILLNLQLNSHYIQSFFLNYDFIPTLSLFSNLIFSLHHGGYRYIQMITSSKYMLLVHNELTWIPVYVYCSIV